jgi:hypothetical protein
MVSTRRVLLLSGLLAGSSPLVSAAQVEAPRQLLQPPQLVIASPITDRFAVRGLFYMPGITTAVRHDNSAGTPGTLVSGEDTLGLQDKLRQFSVDMMFRIRSRHRVRADFFKMTRAGDRVIDQQIRFGDNLYQVNDRVITSLDLRKLGLSYSYSLLRNEQWELGLGLAVHLLQMDGALEVPATLQRERLDGAGPFPTLTTDVTWRATRRFSLNLAGSFLGGSVQGVKGGYQSWHGDLQFRARPDFAMGLGYTQTRFRVDSRTTDFLGYFNLKYQGPEAFLRVSF